MRKSVFIICAVMCLLTTHVFAQEVRGVETRLATYEGKEYELAYSSSRGNRIVFGHSSEYLGFEFTNLNSIPVSVGIEIYEKDGDKLVDTKEIVLKSKESYICKYPTIQKYYDYYDGWRHTSYEYDTNKNWEECAEVGKHVASKYYVKYKAYKLL